MPSLLPCAMLMLIIADGANSVDVILNGLAISFVLELDNAAAGVRPAVRPPIHPSACLSAAPLAPQGESKQTIGLKFHHIAFYMQT